MSEVAVIEDDAAGAYSYFFVAWRMHSGMLRVAILFGICPEREVPHRILVRRLMARTRVEV